MTTTLLERKTSEGDSSIEEDTMQRLSIGENLRELLKYRAFLYRKLKNSACDFNVQEEPIVENSLQISQKKCFNISSLVEKMISECDSSIKEDLRG